MCIRDSNWCIKRLFQEKGTCFYILPTYSQGKKVIWEEMNNDGLRLIDYFPQAIIENKNQQEMKIRLVNGSLFQVIGSDNIDSLVGTNPKIIVFSEYAVQQPQAWDYLRPIVKMNGGYAIFISTPRGKNHFYDLKNIAMDNPKTWFYEELPIDKTNVMTHEDFEMEIKTGMSQEKALQEYYVSFDRGIEGSFYGRLIDKARDEKRIGHVGNEARSNVNTSWDIGFGDSTSIVFWQTVGSEVRIIDFYENQGEGMCHYAKVLQDRKYVYGQHFFPHDAGSGSIQTGKTLVQVARELGINATVLKRDDISVGIEAARALLSVCFLDTIKCAHLIKCCLLYTSIYSRAKQMQEIRLLNGGLSGKFKEQMTKFVLVNHHNYAEKSETKVNQETSYTIKTINYNQPQATLQADQDLLEIEVKPSWSNQQSIQPIDN